MDDAVLGMSRLKNSSHNKGIDSEVKTLIEKLGTRTLCQLMTFRDFIQGFTHVHLVFLLKFVHHPSDI